MSDSVETLPRLERYPARGEAAAPIYLRNFPFTVGRSDKSDLTIDSHRVSREHAVLLIEEGRYVVQDLRSTNGTLVNGQRVERMEISDGDIVTFADVEYSFTAPLPPNPRYAVTQPLRSKSPQPFRPSGPEMVAAVRRLNEALLRGAPVRLERIADLADGHVVGYRLFSAAQSIEWAPGAAERSLLAVECRLTQRVRDVHRRWALETAATLPGRATLVVSLTPAEVDDPTTLLRMGSLAEQLPADHRLAVELPPQTAADLTAACELVAALRRDAIETLGDGASVARWLEPAAGDVLPDWFKVPESSARAAHGPARSAGCEMLMHRARERGVRLLASGLQTQDDLAYARRLGCAWGSGALYGEPLLLAPATQTPFPASPCALVT